MGLVYIDSWRKKEMKFNRVMSANYVCEPKKGSERVIRKFLLFPRCIRGEIRWLETTSIHQRYTNNTSYSEYGCSWYNLAFVDPTTLK